MEDKCLKDFINRKSVIYLAYRLFNFADKVDAMKLEKAVVDGVQDAFKELDKPLDFYPVFFPYRDTLQHSNIGAITWEDVFHGDLNRLQNLFASVASLNGPSFDDGIGVELGYAVAYQVPTIGVINDALVYHYSSREELTHLVDPLLDTYLGVIVSNMDLHGKVFTPDLFEDLDMRKEVPKAIRSFSFIDTLRSRFWNRIEKLTEEAYQNVRPIVKDLVLHPQKYIKLNLSQYNSSEGRVHLEIGGGKYQWQRELAEDLSDELNKAGFDVTFSKRFNPENIASATTKVLAERDLRNALEAETVVVCGDEANVPIGTSFMMGLCKGRKQKVLLYYSGNEYWSEPPMLGPIIRNPMIRFSTDKIIRAYREVSEAVKSLNRS
ncbi:hypothetical protein DRJ25_03155 [Candidatus Woesearchaeota archaeon]|nr:MAG: hypothetical protein DRJ25_03155 [Candidatus Woesearchaeota archaeon]